MVTTRSQAASSYYFNPLKDHGANKPATTKAPRKARATVENARPPEPSPALNDAYRHAQEVRFAGLELGQTRRLADGLLKKIEDSVVGYEPSRRAYETLHAVTFKFSQCVEITARALALSNTANANLASLANRSTALANAIYEALHAAADSYQNAAIAGQDDFDMNYLLGRAANACNSHAFHRIQLFNLTAVDISIHYLHHVGYELDAILMDAPESSTIRSLADQANTSLATAAAQSLANFLATFDPLIASSHQLFPCSGNTTPQDLYIGICRDAASSMVMTAEACCQLHILYLMLNRSLDAQMPSNYTKALEQTQTLYTHFSNNLNYLHYLISDASEAAICPDDSAPLFARILRDTQRIEATYQHIEETSRAIAANLEEYKEYRFLKSCLENAKAATQTAFGQIQPISDKVHQADSQYFLLGSNNINVMNNQAMENTRQDVAPSFPLPGGSMGDGDFQRQEIGFASHHGEMSDAPQAPDAWRFPSA